MSVIRAGRSGARRGGKRLPVSINAGLCALALAYPGSPVHAGGTLDSVFVTATRGQMGLLESPSSVSVVSAESLELQRPGRIGNALREVPNVYVRSAAMGATFPASGQAVLSLRGIPRSIRTLVLIDGMPLNNALSGGINVSSLPMNDIERIEVVRGPHSALYGGSAMGGVINFISVSPDKPVNRLQFGLGSFGQRSLGLVVRRRLPGGLGLAVSIAQHDSDGYDDSDWTIASASTGAGTPGVSGAVPTLQRDGSPGWVLGYKGARPWRTTQINVAADQPLPQGGTLRAGFGVSRYEVGYSQPISFMRDASGATILSGSADVGGGMRVRFGETSFITPTPSSERDLRLFAQWTQPYGQNSTFKLNASVLRHRFNFVFPRFGAAGFDTGPGTFTRQPDVRVDLDASWKFSLGPQWLMTTGVAISRSELDRTVHATSSWRDESTAGVLNTLGQGSMTSSSGFVQGEWMPVDALTVFLGGRYDFHRTHGRVLQSTAPAFDLEYGRRTFASFSPKAAVSWRIAPTWSLRASYGAGFRAPSLLDLYSRVATPSALAGGVAANEPSPNLKPERLHAFDVGADGKFGAGSQWSVSWYRQRLKDLIYRQTISPTLTQTVNAGEGQIDGVEASLRWKPSGQIGRWMHLNAGFAHHLKYEITDNPADPATVGKKITDVPRTTASLAAEIKRGAFSGWLGYHYTSAVFGSGDDMNLNTTRGVYGAYDAHGTFDARIAWQVSPELELALAVENLTDRRYFEFYRQPGRSLMVEAKIEL